VVKTGWRLPCRACYDQVGESDTPSIFIGAKRAAIAWTVTVLVMLLIFTADRSDRATCSLPFVSVVLTSSIHLRLQAVEEKNRERAVPGRLPRCYAGLIFSAAVLLATTACAHKKPVTAPAIASLATEVERAHDPVIQMDFFRVAFVPKGTTVDHLARPGALRGFFGASTYFLSPMPLATMVTYPGLADVASNYLAAVRCKPTDASRVQPILATWPNILQAITTDLVGEGLSCPPKVGDAENEVYCIAQHYHDTAGENVTLVLSESLKAAAELYSRDDPAMGEWLTKKYGIYPAFSGLGLSVKDSYSLGPQNPLSAAVILRNSITPEYLLRNVTLGQGGCRCIMVPAYPERSGDPMDPEFVWQKGGNGSCAPVERLRAAP